MNVYWEVRRNGCSSEWKVIVNVRFPVLVTFNLDNQHFAPPIKHRAASQCWLEHGRPERKLVKKYFHICIPVLQDSNIYQHCNHNSKIFDHIHLCILISHKYKYPRVIFFGKTKSKYVLFLLLPFPESF